MLVLSVLHCLCIILRFLKLDLVSKSQKCLFSSTSQYLSKCKTFQKPVWDWINFFPSTDIHGNLHLSTGSI